MIIHPEAALILCVIISLNIVLFFIGYIIGKLNQNDGVFMHKSSLSNKTNQNKTQQNLANIDIDERKVVTKINTELLEKKYSNIGEEIQTTDNISSAINKLKNMKG